MSADTLRALGDAILGAVLPVVAPTTPGTHAQRDARVHWISPLKASGRIVAALSVRVGDWRAKGRGESIADPDAAVRMCAWDLRARLLARAAWHDRMAAACRAAAAVITGGDHD